MSGARNQCDGCLRGLPLQSTGGFSYHTIGLQNTPHMACTAHLYEDTRTADAGPHPVDLIDPRIRDLGTYAEVAKLRAMPVLCGEAETTSRKAGLYFNDTRQAWEMWAFGIRVGIIAAELVSAARVDLLAPWRTVAALEGQHKDAACALACIDGGRYVFTAGWKWVEVTERRSVYYLIPALAGIGTGRLAFADQKEACFQTGVVWDGDGRRAAFHIALAPEIRTVYWHP